MNSIWQKYHTGSWLIAAIVFLLFGMRSIGLPGLYLDAVNPDYLAAHVLNPEINNFRFLLPGNDKFPVLAGYYYGVQNFYLALPFLAFFGSSVTTIRLAQMVFGAIIVAASTKIIERLSRSYWISLAYGVMVASELAFIASFRTQNFIILGGLAWTFVSLLFLVPRQENIKAGNTGILMSGVFAGLASYGYFVLGFFFPAMILLVIKQAASKKKGVLIWITGVCVGCLPYVVGYAKMWRAAGSFTQFIEQIRSGLSALHPIDETGSFIVNIHHAIDMTRLSLSNGENELMILGDATHSPWGMLKFYLLIGTTAIALVLLAKDLLSKRQISLDLMFALLPVSYFCVAAFFGRRLWGHHFSVLVPFIYLMTAILFARLLKQVPNHHRNLARHALLALFAAAIILPNVHQQNVFFRELNRTGGVGKSSSAMTLMAEEALADGHNAIYAFPDWGFFASFNVLTENRIPYVVDVSKGAIDAERKGFPDRNEIRLAYWDDKDEASYKQALLDAGADSVNKRDYLQRDGRTAFHMLTAHLPPNAP
nr:hypothetical protein [Dyella sp. ASV24]